MCSVQEGAAEGTPEVSTDEDSYNFLLSLLLDPDSAADSSVEAVVAANYELFDFRFMQLLDNKRETSSGEEKAKFESIAAAISAEMQNRMANAAETLKEILSMPSPAAMQGKIGSLARTGKLDDPILLLLNANLEQAKQAGAGPAVKLLSTLKDRAESELDFKAEPELKLVRQLLRTTDSDARKRLITTALTPKTSLIMTINNQEPDTKPEVDSTKLAVVLGDLIEKFGNIKDEDAEFQKKVLVIARECEAVARELGGDMTVRDQQDHMWNKASVSVFDLENLEEEAKSRGEKMAWEGDQESRLQGFEDGTKLI